MCRLQSVLRLSAVVTILLAAAAWTQPPAETPATAPTTLTATSALQISTDPETLGDVMLARHRYQAAIETYKKIPQPTAPVWNKMGISFQMLFDLEDAMRCYQSSLKLDPKNVSVLNNLGTVYDSQKDYGKAVKMYRKALKIQPKSALVLKNLGTDLLAQHKYEKGWEVYKAALEVDPQIFDHQNGPRVENPASIHERGAMNYYMAKGCVRAGKNEQAIEYLRSALSEGFTSPQKVAVDREFAALHGLPAFDQLIEPPKQQ